MKKEYIGIYVKILLIIIFIIVLIIGFSLIFKNEYDSEYFETIKTDMLLIQGKIKIISEKVRIKEKDVKYIGKEIEEMKDNTIIEQLQNNGIIDMNVKENNYYVIDKSNINELELDKININEEFYIIEYNSGEVIYSKGLKNKDNKMIYKLSDIQKEVE